ncbi:MAG: YceH family protein [Acidimicrobiales bacterium]
MELTAEEIRVLGCLVEKERATPDQYPLSTNSLRLACNQKTSRDPIVELSEVTVDQTMRSLRDQKLARTVLGSGQRAHKHKHVLDEAWGLSARELAVLSVIMLRGPQTLAELRTRTERLADFSSLEDVAAALRSLAERPEPFVVQLERRPGQKEQRYAHLLAGHAQAPEWAYHDGPAPSPAGAASAGAGRSPLADRVAELEEEVQSLRSDLDLLRRQFDQLCERLGETDLEG